MKPLLTVLTALLITGTAAIPSAHILHPELHRREDDTPVVYTTQLITNIVTQYADPAPTQAPAPAPVNARVGADGGSSDDSQRQFQTVVTGADGKQVTAMAWNWESPNGAHGVSWRYTVPAAGAPAARADSQPEVSYYNPPAPEATSSPAPAQSASTPQPDAPGDGNVDTGSNDWQRSVVKTHNMHRANHSVPAIAWSNSLAKAAQMVANKCSFTHDMHTGLDVSGFPDGYGQNFACASGDDDITDDITKGWYDEEGLWALSGSYGQANPNPYYVNGKEADMGHFSQVVWKGSTHVGCATATCPNGVAGTLGMKSLTVCDYGPAGNMGGEYAKNVPRPKGS